MTTQGEVEEPKLSDAGIGEDSKGFISLEIFRHQILPGLFGITLRLRVTG